MSRLSVGEAWRRVTDWERHAEHTPLTTIVLTTPPPTHVGTRFVARTAIGPVSFEDPMEVVRWDPPTEHRPHGRCRLEKRGSVVTGWAEVAVHAGEGGAVSRIAWCEALRARWLPPPLDALIAPVGRLFFGRVMSGLLGDADVR
ncbi:MAG TPA: SRPBCC family protein [Thermopolyspora sp.]